MKTAKTKSRAGTTVKKVLLSAIIDYRPGAVVSREIIRKRTGTVTIFAFDRGEGLSEHVAPYDALVLLLEGKEEITVSGRKNIVSRGEMIILPSGKPHAVKALQRSKMLLVMIRS